jgi:GDPmannose 4,6-dehydratase
MTTMPTTRRKALITGITGQDGSYLAELLLAKGYEVHGVVRRTSTYNTDRIAHLHRDEHEAGARLKVHFGDLADTNSLRRVVDAVGPDEVYNLGAQSHVGLSFGQPEFTADVVANGALRLFDVLREHVGQTGRDVRVYQAGSSEMFGSAPPRQNERTPFHPRSPYAVSKVAAHWYAVNYRESYGLFICNGIMFNHESPRRGEQFVTRKISRAVGRIKVGLQQKLYLGNLDARRDWGFAGDYVEAMWLMLQQAKPDDYVVATGEAHTVRELVDLAFQHVDLDWHEHVEVDPAFFRPAEVDYLEGDASKARIALGWAPRVSFRELVAMMVEGDLDKARTEQTLIEGGHTAAWRGA